MPYPPLSAFAAKGFENACFLTPTECPVDKVTTLRPLDDRVAVRPDPAEEKIGNILLTDQAKGRPRRGTVVAVGPGRMITDGPRAGTRIPVGVKVGDRVQFANWGETEARVGDEDWFLLRECDLFGVIG